MQFRFNGTSETPGSREKPGPEAGYFGTQNTLPYRGGEAQRSSQKQISSNWYGTMKSHRKNGFFLWIKPMIIDFYADSVRALQDCLPILEEVSREFAGKINIYKIDTQREQELAAASESAASLCFYISTGTPCHDGRHRPFKGRYQKRCLSTISTSFCCNYRNKLRLSLSLPLQHRHSMKSACCSINCFILPVCEYCYFCGSYSKQCTPLFYIYLGIFIIDFILERHLDYLNNKMTYREMPSDFLGFLDKEKYLQ